jgi:hypothetical protein
LILRRIQAEKSAKENQKAQAGLCVGAAWFSGDFSAQNSAKSSTGAIFLVLFF